MRLQHGVTLVAIYQDNMDCKFRNNVSQDVLLCQSPQKILEGSGFKQRLVFALQRLTGEA